MPDLLLELFSEEIPARMQERAAEDLRRMMTDALVDAGLTYGAAAALSTPRRLTLTLSDLPEQSPDTREERKGPREDAPEKALEGFLRSTGLTRDDLTLRDDKKGKVWFATIEKKGRPVADIVAEAVETTIRNFPWPKSMRWGDGSLKWVRPLHSVLCITYDMTDSAVVPLDLDGIQTGNTTQGHRFMAPGALTIRSFEDYEKQLKAAHVILSPQERKDHIWADATNLAFAAGLEVVSDPGLLDEVAGLVEWPVVLMGRIDDAFLDLPPEVLRTSMKEHQKFFSVRNPQTERIECFITVANRQTADDGRQILAGNQKVLSARLSDAKFFWENDIRVAKSGIEHWTDALDNVTFHNQLGTQSERIARIAALSRHLAGFTGAQPTEAERAARLAKADLASEMVYEFPELQGLMGSYYARIAGEPGAIADVARDHYSPLGPADDVPTAPLSATVALADKIDLLTGFWAIGEKPTGSKDPFALRRAALGVIRIILDNDFTIKLGDLIGKANDVAARTTPADARDLIGFVHDRLKVYLRDRDIRHDVIDACIAMPGSDDLAKLVRRVTALADLLKTDDGDNLVQGYRRANNILTQAEERDGVTYAYGPDIKFAEDDSEKALFAAMDNAEQDIATALDTDDFKCAMSAMATLRAPIDAFFEAVQINTDNDILRRNRLNMLHRIREITAQAADLSRLEG